MKNSNYFISGISLLIFIFICFNPLTLLIVSGLRVKDVLTALTIVFAIFIVILILRYFTGKKIWTTQTENEVITQTENNKKILKSIWFWWFVIDFTNYFLLMGLSSSFSVKSIINVFFELFIPFDLFGFIASLQTSQTSLLLANIAYIIFFVVAVILSDKILNKKNYNISKRIIFNLLILLIIAALINFFRGTLSNISNFG